METRTNLLDLVVNIEIRLNRCQELMSEYERMAISNLAKNSPRGLSNARYFVNQIDKVREKVRDIHKELDLLETEYMLIDEAPAANG